MRRLADVVCSVLLSLSLFQSSNCAKTALVIPASKYASNSGGPPKNNLSPSQIAALCSTCSVPSSPPPGISQINSLTNLSSAVPPQLVCKVLSEIAASPVCLQSLEPSALFSLIGNLCSPSSPLFCTLPTEALVGFVTAIVLNPKALNSLPPSAIVCLLNAVKTPRALCLLSPAVRSSLIHSVSTPKALAALGPTGISALIDVYTSGRCVLAESLPSDLIALLATISSSEILLKNVSACRTIDLLCLLAKLAPTTLCAVPTTVLNPLLTSVLTPVDGITASAVCLNSTAAVVASSPYVLKNVDPALLSYLLSALSTPKVLSTVPPITLVELLADISLSIDLLTSVRPESIVDILFAIKTQFPQLVCDLPSSARVTFVVYLTSPQITGKLPLKTALKLIDIVSYTPCLLSGLPISSVNNLITLLVSNRVLLEAVPLENIVNLIYNLVILSPPVLEEIPLENIKTLLSLLINSAFTLSPGGIGKLLYSLAYSPFLVESISEAELTDVFIALNSSPKLLKEISDKTIVNILAQVITSEKLLTKLTPKLLFDLLINIELLKPNVVCTLPPFAIAKFLDLLDKDPAIVLTPEDTLTLLRLLTKIPCFLTQVSPSFLITLFGVVTESAIISNSIPIDIKIKFIYNVINTISPAVFCLLPPASIRIFADSFSTTSALSNLSPNSLIELTTSISECPCLLAALDPQFVTNFLDVLSKLPAVLRTLKPRVVVNLVTLIASSPTLSASISIPVLIRFLRTLSVVSPSTLCLIPTSASTILLQPLKSLLVVQRLTTADIENVIDLLIAAPCLLGEFPRPVLVNLLTVIVATINSFSRTKIITLLASLHYISPSFICIVPANVVADLLNALLNVPSELSALPPKYIVALTAILSSSPCALGAISDSALNSLLGFLSTNPATLKEIPFAVIESLLTKLALTPTALAKIRLPMFISFLSALCSASKSTFCALPPAVLRALFGSLLNAHTVNELQVTDINLLLFVVTSAPCALNAIVGDILDGLLSKLASTPSAVTALSPSLLTSFFVALTSLPSALNTVRPMTVVNLLVTVALSKPSIICTLPGPAVSTLLNVFCSRQAFASLPPPVLNSLINLLLTYPNLLAALPLSTLEYLICYLSSTPDVLCSLPQCTLVRFLTVVSTLSPLLSALSPAVLCSFLAALSVASPQFLCILPAPVVTGLINAVASPTALAAATPATVASLISTLNRSRCLFAVLPASSLIALLTYLTSHRDLLSNTPSSAIYDFVHNVKYPEPTRPQVTPAGPACAAPLNHFEDFSSFHIQSPAICTTGGGGGSGGVGGDRKEDDSLVFTMTKDDQGLINVSGDSQGATDHKVPKLIIPENANGATVYVFSKNKKTD